MKMMWKSIGLAAVFAAGNAYALNVPGPLVDPAWVNAHKGEVKILELTKKSDKANIPGAVAFDSKKMRVKRMEEGVKGKGLVPSAEQFEKLVQAAGVNKGDAVVIVDAGKGASDASNAARLYWQFKYFGHDNVTILNGGEMVWAKAKLPYNKKAVKAVAAKPGNWKAGKPRTDLIAKSADVEAAMKNGTQILDNRDMGQYLGTWHKNYVFAPGHIPGAKIFPLTVFTPGKSSKFFDADTYKKAAQALNIDPAKPAITYCNSGHLAAGSWFILHEILGNKDVKLYDGSMNIWTLKKKPTVAFKLEN
ncbi:thiosulfate/3-mercaptopyruvate sulfurtransferase [Sulfurivirga caldicuralii]|uniref:Thiosulfate/3-mercaptopyruvate sulfurtransferase n=1 Tax=Sulfurivirga caldicuralii TaxID=364032 RepID=A0A1N6H9L6_9GAMM|nr:rhodanese-like domain-containing protein [Sulfurivirga caldicuralii]SIO16501.1 thiosulfate/3-mercaptopyruvate sulfurtransferase [Sulfurivirga caldicuralii]